MMRVPNEGQRDPKEVDLKEGGRGAGCQPVGSPINLNNTGTRLSENNTGTQSQVFPVSIRDNVYSLTLSEMTDLHGQVWTQLHNR